MFLGNGDALQLVRFDVDASTDGTDTWVKSAGTVADSHFTGATLEEYVNGQVRVPGKINDVGCS